MERHANETNVLETVKVPLQKTTKTGRTTFAYMRRSTTKAEQSSSLPQQEEGIEIIAKQIGIEYSSIDSFVESRSGYENRTRKEWKKMLIAIDKCKEPCTIFCKDTSRLSRNPTDNLEIANRLFGDNKVKKSIKNIYFLGENFSVQEWTDKTNKKYIVDTLHQNYTDSMETKEKSMTGILLRLSGGEFPYTPPKGLSRVNSKGIKRTSKHERTTLMQNEDMSFIKRAFQMKVEGKTAKEISKYLKQYGNIHIAENKIVETIISNTVYKGEYEEQTTKKYFDNIKFFDCVLPISKDLWDRANATIGKRGNGYGDKQADHIARGKIKYEDGNPLYLYTTTKPSGKKYRAYGTEIKTNGGERKTVNIMESKIIKQFIGDIIPKIYFIGFQMYAIAEMETMFQKELNIIDEGLEMKIKRNTLESLKTDIDYIKKCFCFEDLRRRISMAENSFKKWESLEDIENYYLNTDPLFICLMDFTNPEGIVNMAYEYLNTEFHNPSEDFLKRVGNHYSVQIAGDNIYNAYLENQVQIGQSFTRIVGSLKSGDKFKDLNRDKEIRMEQVNHLQNKKTELEIEKLGIYKRYAKLGYTAEIAEIEVQDTEIEIQRIASQIEILSQSTDIEQYLDRLPEIVKKIHELSSNVLGVEDYEDIRETIKPLIEMTTHELVLNNKKELKIELYGTLNNLFFCLE